MARSSAAARSVPGDPCRKQGGQFRRALPNSPAAEEELPRRCGTSSRSSPAGSGVDRGTSGVRGQAPRVRQGHGDPAIHGAARRSPDGGRSSSRMTGWTGPAFDAALALGGAAFSVGRRNARAFRLVRAAGGGARLAREGGAVTASAQAAEKPAGRRAARPRADRQLPGRGADRFGVGRIVWWCFPALRFQPGLLAGCSPARRRRASADVVARRSEPCEGGLTSAIRRSSRPSSRTAMAAASALTDFAPRFPPLRADVPAAAARAPDHPASPGCPGSPSGFARLPRLRPADHRPLAGLEPHPLPGHRAGAAADHRRAALLYRRRKRPSR